MTISKVMDSLGHEIQIGDRVIYNLSGELAVGVIKRAEITRTHKTTYAPYEYHDYIIEVALEGPFGYNARRGHISKVKNPKGIIVIGKIDE